MNELNQMLLYFAGAIAVITIATVLMLVKVEGRPPRSRAREHRASARLMGKHRRPSSAP